MRRRAMHLVIVGASMTLTTLTVLVATASATRPQDAAPPAADEVRDGDRTAVRELIRRLGEPRSPYGESGQARTLGNPVLVLPGPQRWQPMIRDPQAARAQTLDDRASRRAYDGAPPVMPHSRNFIATKSCLDCHAQGIRLGERFGPPLSHPAMVNCMQCHVESKNLDLPFDDGPVVTSFEGRIAPQGGTRAWNGAPPVMPHSTLMRSKCLSCHGPEGYPGLRTDHPQRLNCMQCHAPAASLDQMSPFFTGQATLIEQRDIEDAEATQP